MEVEISRDAGNHCWLCWYPLGIQSAEKPVGFFELRVYTTQPGKRDALAARFANRTAAIYARHGITNVGYWIPQQSDPELGINAENTFIYARIRQGLKGISACKLPMTILNSQRS